MALTFQGGTPVPAQGTAAYNAALAAPAGGGSYNAQTGALSSNGNVIYSPSSNLSVPQSPSSITGANTAPAAPIPLAQPAATPNLMSTIIGNNAGLVGNGVTAAPNGGLAYQDPAQKILDESKTAFDAMLASIKAPVSTADIYNAEYNNAGIADKQQQVQNFTNQINTITAKAQADQLSLTGQGRGVPEVIIGGQQAQVAKEAAIAVLPIQAQLAAAQGNLKLAQDHLDTVFKLKAQDAQAQNDAYNKQVELAYNFFDSQEQKKLSVVQDTRNKNFTLLTNAITFGQELSSKALDAGDAGLAASIATAVSSGLPDQNSPTFTADLAAFTKNISAYSSKIKPKTDSQIIGSAADGYFNVIKDARGNIISTTPVTVGKSGVTTALGTAIKTQVASGNPIDVATIVPDKNAPAENKNLSVITELLKSPTIAAGTKTKVGDALGVINALGSLANAGQTDGFAGISPFNALLNAKIPFTNIGIVPFRKTLQQDKGIENTQYIEAINLKTQLWASGASLTKQQTDQVNALTPTVNDSDNNLRVKINGLANFMFTQVQSQLQTEGINVQPEKVNLFETYDLLQKASPEQRKALKDQGLI